MTTNLYKALIKIFIAHLSWCVTSRLLYFGMSEQQIVEIKKKHLETELKKVDIIIS